MKKLVLDAPVWRTFIRKEPSVKAKLFEFGDEDGTIKQPNLYIPYIRSAAGVKQLGDFGEWYLVVHHNGERQLIKRSVFESDYQSIDG
jgi:hypothetical protein